MYILWWKFMDLSLLQNFFNLDTHFSNGEFWEPPFLNEKFWPLWPKVEFFSLQRFHSTKQANGEFFVVYQDRLKVFWQRVLLSFIHNSYSFLQSNQTLQAFLQNYFKELWTLQVLIYQLYQISALVLILVISSLPSQNQVVMQVIVNWANVSQQSIFLFREKAFQFELLFHCLLLKQSLPSSFCEFWQV